MDLDPSAALRSLRRTRIPGQRRAIADGAPAEDTRVPVTATAATRVPEQAVEAPSDRQPAADATADERGQAQRIALVGELAGVGLLVLVLASAVMIARYSASGLVVHVPAMA